MWILDTGSTMMSFSTGKGQWKISRFKEEIETTLTKWIKEAIQHQWKQMRCAELVGSGSIKTDLISDQFDLEVELKLNLVKKQVRDPERTAAS